MIPSVFDRTLKFDRNNSFRICDKSLIPLGCGMAVLFKHDTNQYQKWFSVLKFLGSTELNHKGTIY